MYDGDLKFECVGKTKSGLTNIYEVQNGWDEFLGEIKWYANWRRYLFFPDAECKFDAICLKKIADFCSNLMEERKKGK